MIWSQDEQSKKLTLTVKITTFLWYNSLYPRVRCPRQCPEYWLILVNASSSPQFRWYHPLPSLTVAHSTVFWLWSDQCDTRDDLCQLFLVISTHTINKYQLLSHIDWCWCLQMSWNIFELRVHWSLVVCWYLCRYRPVLSVNHTTSNVAGNRAHNNSSSWDKDLMKNGLESCQRVCVSFRYFMLIQLISVSDASEKWKWKTKN